MAKGIYVGVNNVARKVKKIYVGAEKTGELKSGNIFPMSGWTEVTAYTTYRSSDNYILQASSANGSSYSAKAACDNSYAGTYFQTTNGTSHWLKMTCPSLTKITKMKVCLAGSSLNNIQVQGSTNNSSWTTLCTISPNSSKELDHYTTNGGMVEITLSNTDYYNYYRLVSSHSSSNKFTVREWWVSEYEEKYTTPKTAARKVKKAYIGVGGVARQFFSSEQTLVYYGTATSLSSSRENGAATSVGDYALFAGGKASGGAATWVDTYDKNLLKSTATRLDYGRYDLSATSVGDYAIFGGGYDGDSADGSTDAYSSSLVKTTTSTLQFARTQLAATTVGNYALFGGGYNISDFETTIDNYSSSLVHSTSTFLSLGRRYLSATSVGDYALFGGGYTTSNTSSKSAVVETFTSSLVKGTAADLSVAKSQLAATTVGNYALFGGGNSGATRVDTYTSDLVKGTATNLSKGRYNLAATSVGDYAIFGGGFTGSEESAVVDTYTSELVKSTTTDLSTAKHYLSATSVGDYALFGGGSDSDGYNKVVNVYQVI